MLRKVLLIFKSIKMKKLKRLEINPQKIINDVELRTLRGGYEEGCTCANAWDAGQYPWEPPSHTFQWFDCGTVDEWRSIMESLGHFTRYCASA